MSEARSTRPGCAVFVVLLVIIVVTVAVAAFTASHQPTYIESLPIYPGVQQVRYGAIQGASRSEADCSAAWYSVPVADAFQVEGFYRSVMLRRGWLGGGDSEYPDPLLFVRKIPGHLESVQVRIEPGTGAQQIHLRLCNDD